MPLNSEVLWTNAGEAMESMFSACPGFEFQQGNFGWIVSTGQPVADFNCAFVAPNGSESSRMEKFAKQFAKLNCPFLICAPQSLALRLHLSTQKLGLTSIGELPLMVIEPKNAVHSEPGPDIEISRLVDADQLAQAIAIGSNSFGIRPEILATVVNLQVIEQPRIKMYVAYFGGVAAAIATTTIHEDAVGIWSMVTLPEVRRRGLATSLVNHVLAQSQQFSTCFLLATQEGRPLYEKVGFKVLESGHVWCGGISGF